jgi:hypothetical protein
MMAPVLNLPYLVDTVMAEVQALEWDQVLASPIPLKARHFSKFCF